MMKISLIIGYGEGTVPLVQSYFLSLLLLRDLKTVLPRFHQHVHIRTKVRNILDQENYINLEECTFSVTSNISKCFDGVAIAKTIKRFTNQKACINGEVNGLSRAIKAVFLSGDKHITPPEQDKKADIKEAKRRYQRRQERGPDTNSSEEKWQHPPCERPHCQMS